jgi:enterochelin esterase-like enzyme
LRMPGYSPPRDLPRAMAGKLENVPFTSRSGEGRRVRVYHPHNDESPRPVLYVHDGIIAVEQLDMPAMIDALIESGRMAPITAVFVNSIDRYDDYAIGSMFSYVFTGEIVKMIEERYPIVPGARGVLGFSRSTVGALDVAVNSGTPFAYCGLVAPAMTAPMMASILKRPAGALPRVTILAGTYDIPLIEDARALRTALGAHHVPVDWFEIAEGHNHTAWRAQLPKLLTTWFPPLEKSRGN